MAMASNDLDSAQRSWPPDTNPASAGGLDHISHRQPFVTTTPSPLKPWTAVAQGDELGLSFLRRR